MNKRVWRVGKEGDLYFSLQMRMNRRLWKVDKERDLYFRSRPCIDVHSWRPHRKCCALTSRTLAAVHCCDLQPLSFLFPTAAKTAPLIAYLGNYHSKLTSLGIMTGSLSTTVHHCSIVLRCLTRCIPYTDRSLSLGELYVWSLCCFFWFGSASCRYRETSGTLAR